MVAVLSPFCTRIGSRTPTFLGIDNPSEEDIMIPVKTPEYSQREGIP